MVAIYYSEHLTLYIHIHATCKTRIVLNSRSMGLTTYTYISTYILLSLMLNSLAEVF